MLFAGILDNEISDHQAIIICANHAPPKVLTKVITVYSNSTESKEKFRKDIESKNILTMMDKNPNSDPNANYTILESSITASSISCMPAKVVQFNRKKHKKDPWITFGILNSVNNKNKLYRRLKKTKSTSPSYEHKKTAFNNCRNLLRRVIRKAKKDYFATQFDRNKHDLKKTWRTLNNSLGRKPSKSSPETIIIEGTTCTNLKQMANAFNQHFINICNTCIEPPRESSFATYLTDRTKSEFQFHLIDNDTTLRFLNKMKISNSCGHDGISNNIIRIIKHEISECLTLIINQSITTGIFPDTFKLAKVIPVYKKNSKLEINNYRPISVLPVLSKIFESVMQTQLLQYFTNNNLFTSQQYGFIPNRSTELAALELMDRNINAMNNNDTPFNIYLDLSKAFDSLDHKLLISKLKFYGLHEHSLKLIQNYLSERSQYVQLDSNTSNSTANSTANSTVNSIANSTCTSDPLNIKRGIPQGSVLGPLLFNIFINDLCKSSNIFQFIMYADDTTLVATLESFGNVSNHLALEGNINKEISKINEWLIINKLQLNVTKSKCMFFYKHPKKIPAINICINNTVIEKVEHFNFLGITLDQHITWKKHTSNVNIKISRVVGLLRKLQHFFPQRILLTIYNSLIHPHLLYGLIVWGYHHTKVEVLQKRAVRVLAHQPYISHTTPIFKDLQILKIKDLHTIQLYKLYYKIHNNALPHYFRDFTLHTEYNDNYNLRNRIPRLPFTRREYYVQCTKYQYLKLIRETPQRDLEINNRSMMTFVYNFKVAFLNEYDPNCYIQHCFVCM